jgi:hypothetical protein
MKTIFIIQGSLAEHLPLESITPTGYYSVYVSSKEESEKLAAMFPKFCKVYPSACSGFKQGQTYGLSVHFQDPNYGIAYNVSFRFEPTVSRSGTENKVTGSTNEAAVKRCKRIVEILTAYINS